MRLKQKIQMDKDLLPIKNEKKNKTSKFLKVDGRIAILPLHWIQ